MCQYQHYTHCLQEESKHFGLRVSLHFCLEVYGQFGIENQKQKISNICKDCLNHTNFSCIIFYTKLSLHII